MKLKKLAAGLLAAVIAVTSTVVAPITSSAATYYVGTISKDGTDSCVLDPCSYVTDATAIKTVEVVTTGSGGGIIGWTDAASGDWTTNSQANAGGTWVASVNLYEDGSGLQVQAWWGDVTIMSATFKDASGAVLGSVAQTQVMADPIASLSGTEYSIPVTSIFADPTTVTSISVVTTGNGGGCIGWTDSVSAEWQQPQFNAGSTWTASLNLYADGSGLKVAAWWDTVNIMSYTLTDNKGNSVTVDETHPIPSTPIGGAEPTVDAPSTTPETDEEPTPEPDEDPVPDAPEGVTPIAGNYDDGRFVQDFTGAATNNTEVVDVDTETTDDTIASLVDGNLYIYTKVAEADLAEAEADKSYVYVKNVDSDVTLKIMTSNAYTKLYDGAEAGEGNVFIAYVISGVTDAADWAWSDIVIE